MVDPGTPDVASGNFNGGNGGGGGFLGGIADTIQDAAQGAGQGINRAVIVHAQRLLNSEGYHVKVDGIMGPLTRAAMRASLNHVHPNVHNRNQDAIASRHPQTGRFQPMRGDRNAPAKSAPRGRGGGGNRGGGGGGNQAPAPGLLNPRKEAQAMANAEYNPSISELQNLVGNVQNQDKYNAKQIGGWYDQMKAQAAQQAADQGQLTQSDIANVTNAIGQDAQLFGGQNAALMGNTASNADSLLQAQGSSDQAFLNQLKPLLDAQAAQGMQNEHNTAGAQLENYQSQLTAQQQAKGAAYNQAYQQALSDQATQEQNQLAMQQAQAMFPSQLSAAQSTAKADRINAQGAGAYNQAKIRAAQAQAYHYQAMSQEEQAVAAKDIAAARSSGNPLAPGTTSYGRVERLLTNSLYNSTPSGKGRHVVTNPIQAQHALYAEAVAQGLLGRNGNALVPGAGRMLKAILAGMYQRDAAWQNGYRWNGRTFVKKR